ncbi:membrane protein insertion efficiency factor YidD [Thermohalobacter berrensis]|uniref:Putative membrane protein insertion efficiency factor n=1 Tax=Thermohalobacter berrensis TaxID=99594 RepID=A0A419T1P4_9FIRM|nr:membrane protein insertion efficiency factor YidD [Thermohalobacter berrensis]RKD31373.1 membrane protein insertion efficiency factor YidD [Thermohalobacter berrensis]
MKNLVIILIRLYQKLISPIKPRTCRFYPTCSEYSLKAITKYGILKGGLMSIKRIVKCNPFNPGGYDPVE